VPEEIHSKEEQEEPEPEYNRVQALRDEQQPPSKTREKRATDMLEEIPITFANIERLGVLDRSLRDIDDLAALLSGILERIGKAPRRNAEEVKLFVASSGNELSFRLVYDVRASASSVG